MLFQSVAAIAVLASSVAAQTYTQTNTTVNIGALDLGLKISWCRAQINSCGSLCGRVNAGNNDCDETTLGYICNCASNSSAPGLRYYENTIPTFLCQRTYEDCIANNVGNKVGQDGCTEDRTNNCGKLDPNDVTPAAATTTSSVVSSATSAVGGAAGSATSSIANAVTTSSRAGGAAPTMAAKIGSGVVAAGVAAAFGLML